VNYFAVGHSSECFSFIKGWVEKKVRRHLMQARNRQGFGWTRWNRQWIYGTLGLFNSYRVRRPPTWHLDEVYLKIDGRMVYRRGRFRPLRRVCGTVNNWGDVPMQTLMHNWYWARASAFHSRRLGRP
jgi:RNA-directed DNA polymerase